MYICVLNGVLDRSNNRQFPSSCTQPSKMHSALVRLQNSFGFFTTVAFCIAILVALSVTLHPQSPSATIELRNVQVYAKAASPLTSPHTDNVPSCRHWNQARLRMKQCERSPALLLNEKRGICPYQIRSGRRSVVNTPLRSNTPSLKYKIWQIYFFCAPP